MAYTHQTSLGWPLLMGTSMRYFYISECAILPSSKPSPSLSNSSSVNLVDVIAP